MPFEFSKEMEARFAKVLEKYPAEHKKAALIPALYLVQEQHGYLTIDGMKYIAGRLDISASEVLNTATFYTLLRKEPHGRFHLQVCTNVSCFLRGSDDLIRMIRDKCGIGPGEMSDDRRFSCEEVQCLAACGTAPVVQVNWDYHEKLTTESFSTLLEELQSREISAPEGA
ncbi:MAG: NAD(P)H-dependent oxidoreductase subunit E [Myxococcales bacterium]|nr:NAD(P)H-dependent oxidoreductase subunit E [Myxococcales bacterium]